MLHLFFVPCSTTGLYTIVRYRVTVLQLVRTVCETRNMLRMYNYNNKNSSTIEMKMVFTQPPPHHHQQQRDQHEAQIPGNCGNLVRKNLHLLRKIAEVQQ